MKFADGYRAHQIQLDGGHGSTVRFAACIGLILSEVVTLDNATTFSLLLLAVADMPARRRSVRFQE